MLNKGMFGESTSTALPSGTGVTLQEEQ